MVLCHNCPVISTLGTLKVIMCYYVTHRLHIVCWIHVESKLLLHRHYNISQYLFFLVSSAYYTGCNDCRIVVWLLLIIKATHLMPTLLLGVITNTNRANYGGLGWDRERGYIRPSPGLHSGYVACMCACMSDCVLI